MLLANIMSHNRTKKINLKKQQILSIGRKCSLLFTSWRQFWISKLDRRTRTPLYIALYFTTTHLELCDSSIPNLSSRSRIFTSIESFHFVVQLPNKVNLQHARACRGTQRKKTSGKSDIWYILGVFKSRDNRWCRSIPFCRALGNDRVTFSSSFW